MRIRLLGLCLALLAAAAHGADLPPAPALATVDRQGYAFDHPRVLAQQRLFGLAHGVSLLAATCLEHDENTEATQRAFLAWQARHAAAIDNTFRELARFYFGARADTAHWLHVVRTLKLREKLNFVPGAVDLKSACRTLPDVLQQPRYDLADLFNLERDLAQLAAGTEVQQRVALCREKLPGTQGEPLDAALARWRAANSNRMDAARKTLGNRWLPESTAEPTLERWLEKIERRVRQTAANEPCTGLAEWLDTPAAHLDQAFALPETKDTQ